MAKPSLCQIRASAGSGKTTELTSRYISELKRLASHGASQSTALAAGILAVTFTNAAANEMRRRVLTGLKKLALSQAESDAWAKGWLDLFLADPSGLNIRTIDSLLHQIVRASALELGISPDYETEFNVRETLAPHVDLVLEQAALPGPLQDRLARACDAALDLKQGKGFASSKNILEPLAASLASALVGKFDELADIATINSLLKDIPEKVAASAGRLLDLGDQLKLAWQPYVKPAVRKIAARGFHANMPSVYYKTAPSDIFKSVPKAQEDALACAIQELRTGLELYYFGACILEKGRAEKPFIDLARDVAAAFRNDPLQRNQVVQALVSRWACAVLNLPQGVSAALCRVGAKLRSFLVDEFQDTSTDQWEVLRQLILEALANGGSFTWVGDVKQSIYGWRDGNPALFDAPLADRELTGIAGSPETHGLENNWRSLHAIVEHNNAIFTRLGQEAPIIAELLLGSDAPADILENLAMRLRSAYADAEQNIGQNDCASGYIFAEKVSGASAAEIREKAAEKLAQILLDDIGPRRPWADVLVLVRSNDQAADLASVLSAHKIPVLTENGLLLAENPLIIQSIAFLSFLNNPDDEVAFWTVIRGSIFADSRLAAGLAGADLAGWAADREKTAPLWRQFRQDFPDLWRRTFGLFYGQPSIMTAYDTIREWHSLFNVEERFWQDETMLRRLLETIHLGECEGMASIAAFLDYWQKNGASAKAPMPEGMDAVRVMTIHKSKGLEARVVIVPCPDYDIKPGEELSVLEVEGITVAAKLLKAMGRPWYEEMARQALEALNLVYVAFTRPREELFLLFPEKAAKGKNTRVAMDHVLNGLGWKLPYYHGKKMAGETGKAARETGQQKPPDPTKTPADDWTPMAWLPRLRIYHAEPAARKLSARQRGTIMHACLELMDTGSDPGAMAEIALKNGISSCGIAIPEAERQGMLEALAWFAAATPGPVWMATGMREQPLVNAEGELLRADLIVPMDWGMLVVDYKSGEPAPEHITQLRAYMRVLSQSGMVNGLVRGLIVYLDRKSFLKISLQDNISLRKPPEPATARLESTLPSLP